MIKIVIFLFLLTFSFPLFAEMITLKSGEVIEGKGYAIAGIALGTISLLFFL